MMRYRSKVGGSGLLLLALLGVGLPSRQAAAQDPTFRIEGRVTDTTGTPIALAQVIAIRTARGGRDRHEAETGPTGRFALEGLEKGEYAVTVRRLGYLPVQTLIVFDEAQLPPLDVELVPLPQRLEEVLVEVSSLAPDPDDAGALFRGVVVDTAGQPIDQVEILAGGDRPQTRGPTKDATDRLGRFGFPTLRPGRYFITVRRIGYLPIRVALTLEKNRHRSVRFEMHPRPVNLPELVVEALTVDMMRVARRVGAYQGKLVTRDEIAEANPSVTGELLKKYLFAVDPETFNEPSLGFDFETVRNVRFGLGARNRAAAKAFGYQGYDCPPVISLNGRPATVGLAINDIEPSTIEAIEVYRRRDRDRDYIPIQLQADPVLRGSCGSLVVIWLRTSLRSP